MAKETIRTKATGDPVYVRMPEDLLKRVDKAVEKGTYVNRSEAIRSAVRDKFRQEQRRSGEPRGSGAQPAQEELPRTVEE